MQRLIATLFFAIPLFALSQKLEDYSLKHNLKQDGLAMQFTVLDSDQKGIRKYDPLKTYYWYKSQVVLGTQGGSSGQLLHGLFEAFYDNKQLCQKGHYAKGLKQGEWNYWRKDGTLIKTEHWSAGRQTGEQLEYSDNGILRKRTIINGRKTTSFAGDTLIKINGNNRSVTLMDSIGRVQSVARYKDHVLHGKQETLASDGTLTTTVYKNGVLVPAKEKKEKTEAASSEEKEPFLKRLKNKLFKKKKSTDNPDENTENKPKKPKKTKKAPSSESKQEEVATEPSSKGLFKRKKA
jgi:antitoxin component YwqK of YwqJK toxin-antitoxin module